METKTDILYRYPYPIALTYHNADNAREVMAAHDTPVNDLHGLVAADPNGLLSEDQLHLSETGMVRCADAVTEAVCRRLAEPAG